MGGGSSKQSEVKAIAKTEVQKKLDQQLAQQQPEKMAEKQMQAAGPSSKPNFDSNPSPSPALSKKSGKAANLQQQSYPAAASQSGLPRNDSDLEGMQSMARPSAVAKQSKLESPSPQQPKQLAQTKMLQQQKAAEEEKMKQMQALAKQNRAKKAAAAAAAQAVPSQGSGMNKEEYFARDNSNQFQIDNQTQNMMLNGPSVMGGLNSQPLALQVSGQGMKRQDSNTQFMMPAQAVAPVANTQFKMVSYSNDIGNNMDYGMGNQGESTQGMGAMNVGVMGGHNNELEQNREIDMAELHALLN